MNPRFMRNGLLMLVLVMGVSALLYTWLGSTSPAKTMAYSGPSSFLEEVQKGEVGKVVQQGETLSVFEDAANTATEPAYTVTVPNVLTQVSQDIATAAGARQRPATDLRPEAGAGQLVDRAGAHGLAAADHHRRLHLLHDAAGPGHE